MFSATILLTSFFITKAAQHGRDLSEVTGTKRVLFQKNSAIEVVGEAYVRPEGAAKSLHHFFEEGVVETCDTQQVGMFHYK